MSIELEQANLSGQLTRIYLNGTDDGDQVLTKSEIQALYGTNTVSGLSLSNSSSISLVGVSFNPSPITWNEVGTPLNLLLNDTDGQLVNEPVSDSIYSGSEVYTASDTDTIVWTLSGDNVESITATRYWVWASFWGVNTTGITPTEAQILAGTSLTVRTNSSIDVDMVTASNQFGWVAVDATQSQTFTEWIVDGSAINRGAIGTGNFIENRGTVSVNGRNYDVYMFDQAKPFNNELTLT